MSKKTATELFRDDYAREWAKFTGKPMFAALIEMLRENSPLEKSAEQIPGNIVVGGHVLYATASGYQQCLKLLKNPIETVVPFEEVEPDYKEV